MLTHEARETESSSILLRLLRRSGLVAVGLVSLAAGCASNQTDRDRTVEVPDTFMVEADREFVRSPFEDQARAGVVRSRIIYDYHFEPYEARLTPLGVRTVETIAGTGSGRLSVRRGTASSELFDDRIETVRDRLLREGVAADRIVIVDQAAGGSGIDSVRAIEIQKDVRDNAMQIPTGEMLNNGGGQ